MVAIAITRTDLTAAEMRPAASRTRDAQAARRMLALALSLEGVDRKAAARTCGMDRQTLRDRVHRYDADGLAGLSDRRGAPRSEFRATATRVEIRSRRVGCGTGSDRRVKPGPREAELASNTS